MIKKYSNRKLYDTELSKYVTLNDIIDRVKNNLDVEILCSSTGKDLTNATLKEALLKVNVDNESIINLIKNEV